MCGKPCSLCFRFGVPDGAGSDVETKSGKPCLFKFPDVVSGAAAGHETFPRGKSGGPAKKSTRPGEKVFFHGMSPV